ncbi:hypothetical protein [Leptolyngbya sp. FACHB-16]|uniref:hypothetical protein n=1 Tax=unclassified Leptolyngbya TaxID=2650499 RepID=UPI0016856329|nr:hypothetical protein [Leptolyngbya sp. FACHB-16]MBD2156724.1 hypothetical protein [Leptolyngbya sp. FACHB-16]
MEAIASLSLLSYIGELPMERDRALLGICLYTVARINEACSLHTADVYGSDGRVRDRITFGRATTRILTVLISSLFDILGLARNLRNIHLCSDDSPLMLKG